MTKATSATRPKAKPRNELQRQSILDAASGLFIEKGFGGTNINDIADALGVTRTAVYYYFPSKEAILEELTEEVTGQASKLARSVSGRDELPPAEALRQLILQHARLILTHPLQFRVVERSESSLPEKRRAEAEAARRSVLAHFVSVIERGLKTGDFEVPDARVAAFSIIGMCNWSAWWFEHGKGLPAEQIADALAELGLRSVTRQQQPRVEKRGSLEEIVAQLKGDVAALERHIRK